MERDVKETAAKIAPQTSIDEMISCCDTVDDFNDLLNECCKVRDKKLSIFLAYILRHNPAAVGIELDKNGWAKVDELLTGLQKSGRVIDIAKLEEIVAADDKGRYSFNKNKSKIRANQGHSIDIDLELEEKTPPDILYHGTAEKYLESIKQNGIEKKTRQFVHLSLNEQTAIKVGTRHGEPVVLKIDTKQMFEDGYKFYLSENGVWLTKHVPFKYVIDLIFYMG